MSELSILLGIKAFKPPKNEKRYSLQASSLERARVLFRTNGGTMTTLNLAEGMGYKLPSAWNFADRLRRFGYAEHVGYVAVNNRPMAVWRWLSNT